MAEKVSPTLNSLRFGVWHGKNGDIEKLFLLLLLPCFSGGKKSWSPSTAASKPYPFWRKRRRRTYMNLTIGRGNQWMEDFSRTPWCCLCVLVAVNLGGIALPNNIASWADWPLGLNIIIYDLWRNRWWFFRVVEQELRFSLNAVQFKSTFIRKYCSSSFIRIHLKSLPYWFTKCKFYKRD